MRAACHNLKRKPVPEVEWSYACKVLVVQVELILKSLKDVNSMTSTCKTHLDRINIFRCLSSVLGVGVDEI